MNLELLSQKRIKWVQANKENNFEEGIKRLLTDLYPDNAHFIYELLQNAEDPQASTVRFTLNEQALEFEHNGKRLFDLKDVESITSIGNSTKRDDPTSIGKFGVGFKAVFAYTDAPEIHSGDFHFRIRDLVVPETNGVPRPNLGDRLTRFVFPFTHPTKKSNQAAAEVERAMRALGDNTLLFLSHIRTIEYLLPDGSVGSLERIDHDNGHIEIRSRHPGSSSDSISHWLRFERDAEVTDDDGTTKSCRVAIAYAMVEGAGSKQSGNWRVVPLDQGEVSIYFPAEKEVSKLRFHIHAPFASTVARDSVRDCAANLQLRDHISDLVIESMFSIRDAGLLTVNFLAVLPNTDDNLSRFYEPIRTKLIKAFREDALTPTKSRIHAPAMNLLRGPQKISNVLGDADLVELLDYEEPVWAANPSQQNQREDKFLGDLDIDEWGWQELADIFSSWNNHIAENLASWIPQKDDTWVMRFYALLGEARDQQEEFLDIPEHPIIRVQHDDHTAHVSPEDAFLLQEDNQALPKDIKLVKPSVYKQGKSESQKKYALSFLEYIGVRTYDERAIIELTLDGYSDASIPAPKSHYKDLRTFIDFWKSHPSDTELFKEHDFLLGRSVNGNLLWCGPSELFLDSPYLETGLAIFQKFNRKRRLWDGYQDKLKEGSREDFIKFAEAIGVITRLPIERVPCLQNLNWDYLRSAPGWRATSPINRDFTIRGLSQVLQNPTLAISKLIWMTMCNLPRHPNYLEATYQINQSGGPRQTESQLVQALRQQPWVPQLNGTFVRPSEADRDLLPEGFTFDAGWAWIKAVEFGVEANKRTIEHQKKQAVARDLGFRSIEEIEKLKRAIEAGFSPDQYLEEVARRNHVAQPEESVPNPERRRRGVLERSDNAPSKESVTRERSILPGVRQETVEAKAYLRAKYKNADGQLICQCCLSEMPFKVGEHHYFEAVQCLRSLDHHYFENRLALCPTCAAMYQYARETDDEGIRKLLMESDANETVSFAEIPIKLAKRQFQLRFVGTHFFDLKTLLSR